MDRVLFRALIFVLTAFSALSAALAAVPILEDDFEGPQPSWRAGEADATYRLEAQQRVRGGAHGGNGSERLQIAAGTGSYVYFSHSIAPARVVAELSPSVWVKSSRPGTQILARVVLPH